MAICTAGADADADADADAEPKQSHTTTASAILIDHFLDPSMYTRISIIMSACLLVYLLSMYLLHCSVVVALILTAIIVAESNAPNKVATFGTKLV